VPFVRAAGQDIAKRNLERIFEGVTIINFNYDRCLEEFLRHWLMSEYAIRDYEAHALVETLNMLRPYGSIGPLPSKKHVNGIPFGENLTSSHVGELAGRIKTFTEQVVDDDELKEIRSAVAEAETIVFLGFGFHDQNMKLLTPPRSTCASRVFGTALGMSSPVANLMKDQITKMLAQKGGVRIPATDPFIMVDPSLTCLNLFEDYRPLLTA